MQLREKLDRVAAELIKTQQPDGYLGTYVEKDRLNGLDDRLMVVVGPCSVHDPKAALRVRDQAGRHGQGRSATDLLVVMRVYFEKPRTTTGWKGLINDPHLDDSGDVNAGLRIARKLLLEVLDLGLPIGCEFLDPITPQYISDTVAWGAIGARTSESQTHRQLGSGLSMPIGFKNRTDGNIQVAVDAVRAAAAPHAFAGIDDAGAPAILHTTGNPDCHIILRGGHGTPNYHAPDVEDALVTLGVAGLPERLVIDASHDNSGKDPEKQFFAAGEIADQVADGNKAIVGVMLESFLVEGRQDLRPGEELTYGQSITDPAWTGRTRCRRWSGSLRRWKRGAVDRWLAKIRRPRGGPDRRLDRARREAAAGGRGRRLGAEPGDRRAGAARRRDRPRRGLGRGGLRGRRGRLLRRAGRRAAGAGRRGAGRRRPGRGGHRRRLDQARAGRRRSATTSASSAATPWPAPRRPASSNARADLFEGARWYLTPTERSSGLLYDRLQRAIAGLGARPQAIDAEAHDRLMATVSHLPHVLANALAAEAAAELTEDSERTARGRAELPRHDPRRRLQPGDLGRHLRHQPRGGRRLGRLGRRAPAARPRR